MPFVVECPAHLECRHYQTVAFLGGEVFIFGTISSIAVEEVCLTAELSERYHALNPFFFLEGVVVRNARRATSSHARTLSRMADRPNPPWLPTHPRLQALDR